MTMTNRMPGCLGHYDFDHIARSARMRFWEGRDTISLLQGAESEREREEMVLVWLLDVEDDVIKEIDLVCRYADQCPVTGCRETLKCMIEQMRDPLDH